MILPGIGNASYTFLLALSILGGAAVPQFFSVDDIPIEYFNEKRVIIGVVERVIDGDTVRIAHCPTYFSCPERDARKNINDTTIKVRAYGIDSPELQKREASGPPSQPFALEAKRFASSFSLDKVVEVKLLDKDQYGRVVGKIQVGSADLSVELTKRGLASLYTGRGAVYDGNKEQLRTAQYVAKERKLGIWSLGNELVTPAEFKRQNGN